MSKKTKTETPPADVQPANHDHTRVREILLCMKDGPLVIFPGRGYARGAAGPFYHHSEVDAALSTGLAKYSPHIGVMGGVKLTDLGHFHAHHDVHSE